MKTVIVIAVIGLVIFIGIQFLSAMNTNKTEHYPYEILHVYEKFEVRQYEERLFTTIKLNSNRYEEVSSAGFSTLAGYIFGGNDKKKKIAMTSPVAMSIEDSMTVMFMVPKELNEEVLPSPNNKNIKFKKMPAQKVAAISFSGWASSDKISNKKNDLIRELKKAGIEHKNNFFFLGYNPPYELINRKNEIIVELK